METLISDTVGIYLSFGYIASDLVIFQYQVVLGHFFSSLIHSFIQAIQGFSSVQDLIPDDMDVKHTLHPEAASMLTGESFT